MPSNSKTSFVRALEDVDNLLWFHENEGGGGQGRRGSHFQSLNKSAIVLLCAAWETYVETVIRECADKSIDAAEAPSEMLRPLQKVTQIHIRDGKVENAWLSVAGEGWKDLTRSVVQTRVAALNTPKPGPIKELMKVLLGVPDATANWFWHRNPLGTPADRLVAFVALRGSIAHGERLPQTVTKARVTQAYDLVERLVDCVEAKLAEEDLLD